MGKVMLSGVAPHMNEPFKYDPVFANNTWEQIIKACKYNRIPDEWEVGDQKDMTINGVVYQIDIIGKNHDDYADGSGKAPLTFQMHDCYAIKYRMATSTTNVPTNEYQEMRLTTLPTILSLMPGEVSQAVKLVHKKYGRGATSTSIVTMEDKLFLLAEIEVFGSSANSAAGEGSQYAYYAAGNNKVKNFNGSAVNWWLRSPGITNSTGYCTIKPDGTGVSISNANYTGYCLSFAFCF